MTKWLYRASRLRLTGIAASGDRSLWVALLFGGAVLAGAQSNVISLAEFQSRASQHGRTIQSFRVEGVVCALVREHKLLALQDGSGTVLLQAPVLAESVQVGNWVAVEGRNCPLSENHFAIQLGTTPVVDNDGHHPPFVKTGSVWLEQGLHPFRVEWFNGVGPFSLRLEYEGPELTRRKVPRTAFWREPSGATNGIRAAPPKGGMPSRPSRDGLEPGLNFSAYVADSWRGLADFDHLKPIAEGLAADLDLKHHARADNTGLIFSGYLEIPAPGLYTFHLQSDDGGRLYVGDPASACRITSLERKSAPIINRLEDVLAVPGAPQWAELEGEVTFAGHNDIGLELEILARGERLRATLLKNSDSLLPALVHREVRATGICRTIRDVQQRNTPHFIIPAAEYLKLRDPESEASRTDLQPGAMLTTAGQVRHLKPAEARLRLRAKITGVVIWTAATAVVVQDATGGVFIHLAATGRDQQPQVGELWEISGTTAPGDFSPVIVSSAATFVGNAAMPEPMRPTWDQLINGSLDAQYVEVRGAVTAISNSEMTLLTPGGKLIIRGTSYRPLPPLPALAGDGAGTGCRPLGSIVRLRGCLTAEWDVKTKQVSAGIIYMGAPIVDVEEPTPADPFALPTRKTADLLHFDARASALQRTKLAGQVIYARPREYCVLDGTAGLRFLTREALPLQIGDTVEGVGFPQIGGPSPVLYEAQVRKTGSAPLPKPVALSASDLLDRNLDSTLVQVEAVLINAAENREERLLELQSGPAHFRARLKRQPGNADSLAPGSRLQLRGVYSSARGEPADDSLDPFELLLTDPAAITVLQKPPWWTMRKAITIVAILAGGLGVALVWITLLRRQVEERTSQLQRQIEERQFVEQRRVMEQERTRVAQDLHDELGAGLTEVGLLGSLAKNPSVPSHERERYLDRLTEAARSLVTGLDEIVWAVNPHYDSVASLASYYSLFAQRFLNLAGIACRLKIAEQFPDYPLDSRLRHGIFLAFKEALNNVVRHSEATEVGLVIGIEDDQLRVAVSDNGRGLESLPRAPGKDGLAGMRDRIAKLGGNCDINSHPGRGTTVEFRLPLQSVYAQKQK